jgi:hypothetical protein
VQHLGGIGGLASKAAGAIGLGGAASTVGGALSTGLKGIAGLGIPGLSPIRRWRFCWKLYSSFCWRI